MSQQPYRIVDKPIVRVTSPHLRLFDAIVAEFLVTSHTDRMRLANGGRVEWSGLGKAARSIIEKETYLTEVPRAAVWWVTRGRGYSGSVVMGLRAMAMGWADFVVVDRISVFAGAGARLIRVTGTGLIRVTGTAIPPYSPKALYSLVEQQALQDPTAQNSSRFRAIHYVLARSRPLRQVEISCMIDDGKIDLLLEETAKKIELPKDLTRSLYDCFFGELEARRRLTEPITVTMDACEEKGDFLTSEVVRLLGDSIAEYPCYLDCPSRGVKSDIVFSSKGSPSLEERMRCHRHRFVRRFE